MCSLQLHLYVLHCTAPKLQLYSIALQLQLYCNALQLHRQHWLDWLQEQQDHSLPYWLNKSTVVRGSGCFSRNSKHVFLVQRERWTALLSDWIDGAAELANQASPIVRFVSCSALDCECWPFLRIQALTGLTSQKGKNICCLGNHT